MIEVLSSGNTTKELITKLDLYRDSGIEEYWIVDPIRTGVLIYHFSEDKIMETRAYNSNAICESIIYPGFHYKVRDHL